MQNQKHESEACGHIVKS